MILGAYYLTYGPEREGSRRRSTRAHRAGRRPHVFPHRPGGGALATRRGTQESKLHDLAEFRPLGREGGHVLTTVGRIIYNDKIERALGEALGDQFDPSSYEFVNRSMKKKDTTKLVDDLVQSYGAASISQVLDAFKDIGFHYATQAGVTVSKNDVQTPPNKAEILARYDDMLAAIDEQYNNGEMDQEERHEAVTRMWNEATDKVAEAMVDHLDELNPIFMMANSGARGSFQQIRQLAGMRGLMANPKGEIIERPIKSNFMEGLDVLEYFISTHGARKGLADTALRTADSGYLTRRLVDVAQDVIIRQEDCGTDEYIEMPVLSTEIAPETRQLRPAGEPNVNLIGRIAAAQITTERGRVIVEKGVEIDSPSTTSSAAWSRSFLEDRGQGDRGHGARPVRAEVRGPDRGLPGLLRPFDGDRQGGADRRRGGHHRRPVDRRAGHAADDADVPHRRRRRRGHHARPAARRRAVRGAQAQGPRENLRGLGDRRARRGRQGGHGRDHRLGRRGAPPVSFPRRTPRLYVNTGEKIEVGKPLNEGSLYPHEVLAHGGKNPEERRTETELYLVREVQEVYKSQGVDINDKHIELIVRQMMKKVRVDQKGDTDLLPGQYVDRHDYARIVRAR